MATSIWEVMAVILVAACLWLGMSQFRQQGRQVQLRWLSQQLQREFIVSQQIALQRQAEGVPVAGVIEARDLPVALHEHARRGFAIDLQRRIVCLRHCAQLRQARYAVDFVLRAHAADGSMVAAWLQAHGWQLRAQGVWLYRQPLSVAWAKTQKDGWRQYGRSLQRLLAL